MRLRKITAFLIIIFFLACPYPTYGQATGVLFLTQIVTSAVEHNPEIQKQRAQLQITQAEARASSSVQNPYFSFDADPIENLYRFGIQKAIETGGAPKWSDRASEKRLELQQAELEESVLDLKSKVANAYTDVYVNQDKISFFKEAYEYVKAKYEEKKDSALVDNMMAEEELMHIEQQQQDAKIEIEKAEYVLETLAGEHLVEGKKLENPRKVKVRENLQAECLINLALEKRPEIHENNREMELAQILRKLALANRYPLVILEVGTDNIIDREGEERGSQVYVSADIELPVLGIERKQIQASNTRIEQVRKKREGLEKSIKIEIFHALREYEYAKERIEKYEKEYLPRTAALAKDIREKYEKNGFSLRDLLMAEDARIEVQKNYYEALSDYEIAVSTLEKAVGTSLTEETPGSTSPTLQEGILSPQPMPHPELHEESQEMQGGTPNEVPGGAPAYRRMRPF